MLSNSVFVNKILLSNTDICLKCVVKAEDVVSEVTVRSRVHDVQEDWKPEFLSNEEFTYLMLEALEGFVMVFSTTGRIYYVSESITSLLGHNPVSRNQINFFRNHIT